MLTYIVIPTYNEAENILPLIKDIRREVPDAHILVVDDSSPDGTAQIVSAAAAKDAQVHVLVRTERGRGTAGRDGFLAALKAGAGRVVEMDADYSHHPRYLPAVLAASESAQVVLGSRYVKGGAERGRPIYRQWLTRLVGTLLRLALGVRVHDPSSGYRCFTAEALQALHLEKLVSTGPSIVSELLYKARLRNLAIVEVPIIFEDRKHGTSKLSFTTLLETLVMVFRLRKLHRSGAF